MSWSEQMADRVSLCLVPNPSFLACPVSDYRLSHTDMLHGPAELFWMSEHGITTWLSELVPPGCTAVPLVGRVVLAIEHVDLMLGILIQIFFLLLVTAAIFLLLLDVEISHDDVFHGRQLLFNNDILDLAVFLVFGLRSLLVTLVLSSCLVDPWYQIKLL